MSAQLSWKFQKGKAGHYWEAYNQDGEIVGRSSQNFSSRSGAQYNARLLGYENEYGSQLDWRFEEDGQKGWGWKVYSDVNFEEVGASDQYFVSREEAEENAALFGYKSGGEAAGARGIRWLPWLIAGLALLGIVLFWPQISNWLGINRPNTNTVVTSINAGNTTQFSQLLNLSGVGSDLVTNKEYTLFAPTNDALNRIPQEDKTKLEQQANRPLLAQLMRGHIVEGRVNLNDTASGTVLKSLAGTDIVVEKMDNTTKLNGILVNTSSQNTANGLIYTVEDALGYTQIAPQLVNVSNPVSPEASAPAPEPQNPEPAQPSVPQTPQPTIPTVSELLQNDTRFSTLRTALSASGLSLPSQFTVFAPTNDAFAKLPAGELDRLLLPENKGELSNLLRYHILSSIQDANALQTAGFASTLLGQSVLVELEDDGTVHLISSAEEHAHVVQANVQVQGGLVHAIDAVLIPFAGK